MKKKIKIELLPMQEKILNEANKRMVIIKTPYYGRSLAKDYMRFISHLLKGDKRKVD